MVGIAMGDRKIGLVDEPVGELHRGAAQRRRATPSPSRTSCRARAAWRRRQTALAPGRGPRASASARALTAQCLARRLGITARPALAAASLRCAAPGAHHRARHARALLHGIFPRICGSPSVRPMRGSRARTRRARRARAAACARGAGDWMQDCGAAGERWAFRGRADACRPAGCARCSRRRS